MRRPDLLILPIALSLVACTPSTPATPTASGSPAAAASPAPAAAPSAAASPTASPAAAAASAITFTEAAWVDKNDDKVGTTNAMQPNGKKDGHIRITLTGPADVTIKSMAINPVDKAAGKFTTVPESNDWRFGIFEGGTLLNTLGKSPDLALNVNGGKTYDLYAEGEFAGGVVFFQPGMAYDVVVTDSKGATASKRFTVS